MLGTVIWIDLPYQTYDMEHNGKLAVQHESQIQYYAHGATNDSNSVHKGQIVSDSLMTPEPAPLASQMQDAIEFWDRI